MPLGVQVRGDALPGFSVSAIGRLVFLHNPSDLWTMSMSGNRTRQVFLSSKYSELNGTFSPDGWWVAYQSNASGRDEVLVRPFPNKDPARMISRDILRHEIAHLDGEDEAGAYRAEARTFRELVGRAPGHHLTRGMAYAT